MEKGDTVVSLRDLGGFFSESVPKGTKGVVTQVSWSGNPERVMFVIPGGVFSTERRVEVSVTKGDVM